LVKEAIMACQSLSWFTDGNPLHRLMLALGTSLIIHGLVVLATWFAPAGSPLVLKPHVFQASFSYRPDPVAIYETVTTNDPDAVSPARRASRPEDAASPVPAFILAAPRQETPPAERSIGLPGRRGGGDDCWVSGFRFCSS
jgi:hypothetical protein